MIGKEPQVMRKWTRGPSPGVAILCVVFAAAGAAQEDGPAEPVEPTEIDELEEIVVTATRTKPRSTRR